MYKKQCSNLFFFFFLWHPRLKAPENLAETWKLSRIAETYLALLLLFVISLLHMFSQITSLPDWLLMMLFPELCFFPKTVIIVYHCTSYLSDTCAQIPIFYTSSHIMPENKWSKYGVVLWLVGLIQNSPRILSSLEYIGSVRNGGIHFASSFLRIVMKHNTYCTVLRAGHPRGDRS